MLPGLITKQRAGVFFILRLTPPGKKPPQRCASPVKLAENILRKASFRNHGLLSVYFLPNSLNALAVISTVVTKNIFFNSSAMAIFLPGFLSTYKKAAGCYACGQFGRMLPLQQR
ncbi:hypothetical protein [Enterobacter sp. Colony194]|uniref:hypothetical protein n=1 Tax=Enterobacter sp. Colony194 TaxID=2866201 RepID=UPI001C69F5BA|nr:hypothetical protein [Enterobacter sp. Colony194]